MTACNSQSRSPSKPTAPASASPRIAIALLLLALSNDSAAAERAAFDIRETAGLQRFDYPVTAILTLPRPETPSVKSRLLQKDAIVPAQFSLSDQDATRLTVDFKTNAAPGATPEYALEYGDDVAIQADASRRITASQVG